MSDYLKKFENNIINKKDTKINTIPILDIPIGRCIEVRSESSAKDYFVFEIIKNICKKTKVLYVDVDCSLDINFLKNLGINMSNMLIYHPELESDVFDKLHKLLNTKEIELIIINSVLSILPQDKDYQQFKKKLQNLCKNTKNNKKTIIFVNPYDSKRYNILEEFCSLIIFLKKRQKIGKNRENLGYFIDGYILKNTLNLKLSKFCCKVLYNKGLQKT